MCREVRHTFKKVGMKSVVLTQTVVSTGEQHVLESYVMVKVRCSLPLRSMFPLPILCSLSLPL